MKYVLVTGASGGMGQATVRALRHDGYGVLALDRAFPADVPDDGIWRITADVTNPESVQHAADAVRRITDSLYAIVHFAGIYLLDSLLEMEDADFLRIVHVNLCGAYLVNRHFADYLTPGSRILLTTSELAPLDPLPFTGIYAVTKGALDKYAYALRMEAQLSGIHVSVLRAGAVDTGMLDVSTAALDRFCAKTKRYACNAARFRRIVDGVEAKKIAPEALAGKVCAILEKRNPAFAYSINRNPLLRLYGILPKRTQLWAIREILRSPKQK